MKKLIHKTMAVTLAAVFAGTIILTPTPASAKWHDQSGELPGFADLTPVLVIGGVLVAGSVVLLIHKHHSKANAANPKTKDKPDEKKADSVTNSAVAPYAPHQRPAVEPQAPDTTAVTPVVPEKDSRLNLYIGLTNDRALYHSDAPAMDFSDYTVRAGVTFGF